MNAKAKVILWGGSNNSICKGLDWLNEGNVEIVAIADRDKSKKLLGNGFGGLFITPDQIHEVEYDYIVICTSYVYEVLKQMDQLGIDRARAVTVSRDFNVMDMILRDYKTMSEKMEIQNRLFKWKHVGIESYALQWMANKSCIIHKYYDKDNQCFDFSGIKIPYETYLQYPSATMLGIYDIFLDYIEECKLSETNEGPYEYGGVQLEEGDTVIDCGANQGLFSALAAFKVKNGKVHSFEPIPEMVTMIERIQEFYPNIRIEEYAVTNKCGTSSFEVDEQNAGASHLVSKNMDGKNIITVQNISLDEFVIKTGINKIDFIKADIEGEEPNMLLGATTILKEHAPKLSICTYHNPNHPLLLENIIREANPNYIIEHRWKKLFAYVPR